MGRLRGYPGRRWLIRHGLQVGRDVYIDDFAFDHGFLWLISIGDELFCRRASGSSPTTAAQSTGPDTSVLGVLTSGARLIGATRSCCRA